MDSAKASAIRRVSDPWQTEVALVDSIRTEIEGVATYALRYQTSTAMKPRSFQPGQFNMLYIPGCGEVAISISGAARENESLLLHTIRRVGRVTEAISKLKVGDAVGIRGPFGTPWPIGECYRRDMILVAGGIGLAPLRPVLYQVERNRQHFGRVILLLGARSPELLLFTEEYMRWKEASIEVQVTVDRADIGSPYTVGVVPLLIDRLRGIDPINTQMLTCGPEVMMHYSAISAMKLGLSPDNIWLSLERNMQCAVGFCGHCQLGPAFLCKDGPVFRYSAMEKYLHVRDL
jgi:NAD(P)H-flavin reductase